MDWRGGSRKKLRARPLELLKARTAARLGFRSVDHWEAETTTDERQEMMALALLDGWGEEWAEIAAMLVNVNVTSSEHAKSAYDLRRFQGLEAKKPPTGDEWQVIQSNFERMILRR